MNTRILFLIFAFSGKIFLFAQKPERAFTPTDKVAYVGNSITHSGFYHSFVDTYYLLHYPNEKIQTYNCGIGGNVAADVLKRMDSDILIHKPTVATLKLGMNDVGRDFYGIDKPDSKIIKSRKEQIDQYKKDIEKIVKTLISNKIRVILLSPSIYDQESGIPSENQKGVNDALAICAAFIKELSQKYKCDFVDFYGEMQKIQSEGLNKDKNFALAGADRIHPEVWGHFLMANIFLNALEKPKLVSELSIDFYNKGIANMENCSVSNLTFENDSIRIENLENSLPFPLQADVQKGADLCDFSHNYNKEIFKVIGLFKGRYLLKIDGKPIETFTESQLENGINLAQFKTTPQYIQAEQVLNLYRKRHVLISGKLRTLAYIEYGDLDKMKNPRDENEIREIFAKKIANAVGRPWHQYIIDVTTQYFEDKKNEPIFLAETESLLNEVYTLNKPKKHIYSLIRL
jgi:lysophospholipase L1-like esterase